MSHSFIAVSDDLSRARYELESFLLGGGFDLYEDDRFLARVEPNCAAAEISYSKLILYCWGESWSRSWRVVGCAMERERLLLQCTKQMNRTPCLVEMRQGGLPKIQPCSRDEFARMLAAMVETSLAGVRVVRAVAARDDARHLSGIYARLILSDRGRTVAAIGVSEREPQPNIDAVLGAGIVWLDCLRRERKSVDRLIVFAPRDRAATIASRMTMLRPGGAQVSLYEVDEASRCISPATAFDQGDLADRLRRAAMKSFRRADQPRRRANRSMPERWLESIIRRDLAAIDATLHPRFVYSQVPAFRGSRHSFIDLLAATREGRLVVIELKVSEDAEFPMQGLDYWLRVEWHRERGDFERRGYFDGLRLANAAPMIYLVAPLFRFHATTRLIASAIADRAPVYRVGINEDWSSGVKVRLMERLN